MAKTIFSASKRQQDQRVQELEAELRRLKNEEVHPTFNSEIGVAENHNFQTETIDKHSKKTEETGMKDQTTSNTERSLENKKLENKKDEVEGDELNSQPLERKPEEYSELMKDESPTTNPLAAFVVRPPGAKFINQHIKEKILLVLRQHPVVNLKWMFLTIILVLAPFVLFPYFPFFDFVPGRFQFFILLGWYLLISAYVIENFLYWYYNIYIITDERIIDIDFYSLIYRSVSEAKIDKIEDVTATTAGLFAGVFNYGNITIQTAAEKREFDFNKVPQPAKVTKFLNELILEEEREKNEGRVM